jgi:Zn-dependent peptidase ImmA (M78 family)
MHHFRNYRYDTIRDMADRVRKTKTRNPSAIPVDIDRIVEIGYRMKIMLIDGLRSPDTDMEAILSNDFSTLILDKELYTNDKYNNRRRFTMAHEIGHRAIHKEFYSNVKFRSPEEWILVLESLDPSALEWYEWHADEFAGRLLVPIDALKDSISQIEHRIEEFEQLGIEHGIADGKELDRWKISSIANELAPYFEVAPKTIELRILKEKIALKKFFEA